MEELVHAFSCAYMELWMYLGSLESTQEACSRLSPRATLTLLSCSPNFPRASITRYTQAKHEPILCFPIALPRCGSNSKSRICDWKHLSPRNFPWRFVLLEDTKIERGILWSLLWWHHIVPPHSRCPETQNKGRTIRKTNWLETK